MKISIATIEAEISRLQRDLARERAALRAQQEALEADRLKLEREKQETAHREREVQEAAALAAQESAPAAVVVEIEPPEEMASDLQDAGLVATPAVIRPTLAELAADVAGVRGISVEQASDMIVEAVHAAELAFADNEFDVGN